MIATAKSSVDCVGLAAGLLGSTVLEADYFGDIGEKIEDSQYYRDYCYLCNEPIRVPCGKLREHNACMGCQRKMQ